MPEQTVTLEQVLAEAKRIGLIIHRPMQVAVWPDLSGQINFMGDREGEDSLSFVTLNRAMENLKAIEAKYAPKAPPTWIVTECGAGCCINIKNTVLDFEIGVYSGMSDMGQREKLADLLATKLNEEYPLTRPSVGNVVQVHDEDHEGDYVGIIVYDDKNNLPYKVSYQVDGAYNKTKWFYEAGVKVQGFRSPDILKRIQSIAINANIAKLLNI